MVSRRPSDPPPDRLARLLQETRDDAVRAGEDVPSDRDTAAGEDVHEWELEDDGWDPLDPTHGAPPSGRHRQATVPVFTVPAWLRSAQLAVGARAVRGLLVLALVAVLVLGARWLWAQRPAEASGVQRVAGLDGGEEVPTPGVDAAEETGEGSGGPTEDDAPDAPPGTRPDGEEPGADLVVHVTGAVEEPGVVKLPAGSRVVDAVRAAGGLTGEADQSSVNLARPLVDGEQLWVGRPGEEPPAGWSPPAEGPGLGAGGAAGASGAQPAPLDLNTATQADLEELPGIGPVTAGHILAWRDEHGRFSRVDELLEVSGIGERTLAQLEPLVTVGG